jgi:deazaflavin-dependent oxidoreductase (nitroreductase family)
MAAEQKDKTIKAKRWLRRFNRKITNPIMMTLAGRRIYTVVDHVGRRSKKVYHTPVLGQPNKDGFVIPLPYGKDTDWCLNVLAVGGCTVHRNRQTYQLTSLQIVERAVGEAVLPAFYHFLFRSFGVELYLKASR